MQGKLARRIVLAVAVLILFPSAAFADPPGRVGRVTFLAGTVAFFSDPDEGWHSARINFPVTSENSLWTDPNGRAEVRIGSSALRVDGDSVIDFQRLDDQDTLAYLQRGTVSMRIRSFDNRDIYRVTTPDGQFALISKGRYRIDTDPDRNESRITVFEGRARIDSQGAALTIERGRTAVVRLAGNAPNITFETTAQTDFDDWTMVRDERWDSRDARYVSPYMTGYEDLEEYGEWVDAPEYGTVWYPTRVDAGWVPYRHGYWAWVRPWGWTWVDDAPWGFAPFHYGRWVHIRNRWGWWPGTYIGRRPVFAPALVAWIGSPGWNVSYSLGSGPGIGWCPLAPYEPYLPGYTNNTVYIRNINNIYVNRPVVLTPPAVYANHKPGATVVSPMTITTSAPVAGNLARVRGEAVIAQPATQATALLPQRAPATPGASVVSVPGGKPGLVSSRISERGPGVPAVGGHTAAPPVQIAPAPGIGGQGVVAPSRPPQPAAPAAPSNGSPLARPAPVMLQPGDVVTSNRRSGGEMVAPQPVYPQSKPLVVNPSPQPAPAYAPAEPRREVRVARPAPAILDEPRHGQPRVEAAPHAIDKQRGKPIEVSRENAAPGAKMKEN